MRQEAGRTTSPIRRRSGYQRRLLVRPCALRPPVAARLRLLRPPPGDDPEDEIDDEGSGRDICGNCNRGRNWDAIEKMDHR